MVHTGQRDVSATDSAMHLVIVDCQQRKTRRWEGPNSYILQKMWPQIVAVILLHGSRLQILQWSRCGEIGTQLGGAWIVISSEISSSRVLVSCCCRGSTSGDSWIVSNGLRPEVKTSIRAAVRGRQGVVTSPTVLCPFHGRDGDWAYSDIGLTSGNNSVRRSPPKGSTTERMSS